MTELLFSVARPSEGLLAPNYREDLATVAEVTGFKPGTNVTEVMARLGEPTYSECGPTGFKLGYSAKHGNSYREWYVYFDAHQRYVDARRTHPGY